MNTVRIDRRDRYSIPVSHRARQAAYPCIRAWAGGLAAVALVWGVVGPFLLQAMGAG